METNLEKDEFFKKCVGRLLACRNILVKGGIQTESAAGCAVEIENCADELRQFCPPLGVRAKGSSRQPWHPGRPRMLKIVSMFLACVRASAVPASSPKAPATAQPQKPASKPRRKLKRTARRVPPGAVRIDADGPLIAQARSLVGKNAK